MSPPETRLQKRPSASALARSVGNHCFSFCTDEQCPVMAKVLQRLSREERVENTGVNLLTANGQEAPIAWSCSSMRDDAGEVLAIVAVGRDLAERRQLEAQLRIRLSPP